MWSCWRLITASSPLQAEGLIVRATVDVRSQGAKNHITMHILI